jgi:hypothetical protein
MTSAGRAKKKGCGQEETYSRCAGICEIPGAENQIVPRGR